MKAPVFHGLRDVPRDVPRDVRRDVPRDVRRHDRRLRAPIHVDTTPSSVVISHRLHLHEATDACTHPVAREQGWTKALP